MTGPGDASINGTAEEKLTTVANSYSDKLTRSKPERNYWSLLTSLVEELEEEESRYKTAAFDIESKKEKALRINTNNIEMNEIERK